MSQDQFTTVTTKGYGQRIISSIGGILVGILLFFGSFALLFWNEGRADMSKVAEQAVEVSATQVNPDTEGELVAVSGVVTADSPIGDTYLTEGNYLALRRNVEMFAWEETSESKTQKKVGGSEETTTTYSYSKKWLHSPEDSARFKNTTGHMNPPMAIEGTTIYAPSASLGAYSIQSLRDMALLSYEEVPLQYDDVLLPEVSSGVVMSGTVMSGYIYMGNGTITAPEVGDMRISYEAIRDNTQVTVLAQQSGGELVSYTEKGKGSLFGMYKGTLADAVQSLANAHTMMSWGLRIGGFFMMWIGLSAIFAPLSVILDVLPFLGSISRGLVGLVTFIVSLILSIITIVISMILHNIIILIILALVTLGGTFYYLQKRTAKKLTA